MWQRKAQRSGFRVHSSMSVEASRGFICAGSPWGTPGTSCGLVLETPCYTALILLRKHHAFTGQHGNRLKAISTFETSNDIGANAFPTGLSNGTFICVWLEISDGDIITRRELSTLNTVVRLILTDTGLTGQDLWHLQAVCGYMFRE